MRHLTPAEIAKFRELVEAGREIEYRSFGEEDTFAVLKQRDVPTGRVIMTARELLQWKNFPAQVKCRVVLRGFQDDRRHHATDSPTLRMESWRLITQQAADLGQQLWKFDLKTAFLQGIAYDDENELVYWTPPPFFRKYYGMKDDEVCVALKSIYGLKDAPRAWRKRLHQVLTE